MSSEVNGSVILSSGDDKGGEVRNPPPHTSTFIDLLNSDSDSSDDFGFLVASLLLTKRRLKGRQRVAVRAAAAPARAGCVSSPSAVPHVPSPDSTAAARVTLRRDGEWSVAKPVVVKAEPAAAVKTESHHAITVATVAPVVVVKTEPILVAKRLTALVKCDIGGVKRPASEPSASAAAALPPKKRLVGLGRTDTLTQHNLCFRCGMFAPLSALSVCLAKHRCCSICLQELTKGLLTSKLTDQLMCHYPQCSSFYAITELRKSLPPMVIEIIEERLETDYVERASSLMMMDFGSGDASSSTAKTEPKTKPKTEPEPEPEATSEFPSDWEPMGKDESLRIVPLDPDSASYNILSALFHDTMPFPRSQIINIKRVQNPTLWQFYTVKKKQMLTSAAQGEPPASDAPPTEMTLFHGTRKAVVDAICRTNFDWRICGTNGTTFGEGSYFARDSKYSHKFTEKVAATHTRVHHQTPQQVTSPTVTHAVRTMIVAKVLVGCSTLGSKNLRRPPPLDPNTPFGRCYDSCSNTGDQHSSIWVLFDSSQSYPAYTIDYLSP